LSHGACQSSGRIALMCLSTNWFRQNLKRDSLFAALIAVLKKLLAQAEFQGTVTLQAAWTIEGELLYNWLVCRRKTKAPHEFRTGFQILPLGFYGPRGWTGIPRRLHQDSP